MIEADTTATFQAGESPRFVEPVSVVIPTKHEAENVETLLERLAEAMRTPFEVVFVDDSDDETPDVITTLSHRVPFPVSLIYRPSGQRIGGLGGAALAGIRASRHRWVCVMDGDLQHPPSLLPQLLAEARRADADLVLASRYRTEGGAGGLNALRAAISRASTIAARLLFPGRLSAISDPMTGYFLVRKDRIDLERLQPRGFKILLEIVVRHPQLRVAEVGFHFGRRHAGRSKGTVREGITYLSHLWSLRRAPLRGSSTPVGDGVGMDSPASVPATVARALDCEAPVTHTGSDVF